MKLTTKTRYAVRTMADLANQPEGKATPLTEIARRQGLKPKYLAQIFIKLHHARLIKSRKGPGGGYYIDRDPRTIKISEIMEAVGESKALVFCVDKKRSKHCPRMNQCPTHPYWRKLNNIIDIFFDSITLYDISKRRTRGNLL
ncbi:MAG: RrF2 family transcriptional regulator [candidate division WOR-3 bacterium]|nr:MAG: RrF2 family transcriptional regulator [candidate division WOR-3 bacterium]